MTDTNTSDDKSDRAILMGLLHSMDESNRDLRDECDRLRGELEKAARVDAFCTAINMLRMCATDPGAAKNYVAIATSWDEALAPGLPFRRAQIVFVRDGAKMPCQIAADALKSRDALAKFARGLITRLKQAGETELVCADWLKTVDEFAAYPDANSIDLRPAQDL